MAERKFRSKLRNMKQNLNIHSDKSDEWKFLKELLNVEQIPTKNESSNKYILSNVEPTPIVSPCEIEQNQTISNELIESNGENVVLVEQINSIQIQNEDIDFEQAKEAIESEFQKVSARSITDLKPEVNYDCAFKIEFKEANQKPIKCKSRPLPYNLKDKVRLEIDKLLKAGIIRESKSEWCSPIRVVDKPDGSIRLTVDYKELNKVIKDDNYPIPSISDMYNN